MNILVTSSSFQSDVQGLQDEVRRLNADLGRRNGNGGHGLAQDLVAANHARAKLQADLRGDHPVDDRVPIVGEPRKGSLFDIRT